MSPFLNPTSGTAGAIALERPALDRVAPILFWEYAARGWRSILFGPAIALLIPAFILAIGWLAESMDAAKAMLKDPIIYWEILLVLVAVNLVEQGQTRPRYNLPASSWLLAGIPMISAMLAIFVHYGITALIVNSVLHYGWRLWGPGLHAALLMAWCQLIFLVAAEWRSLKWVACLLSFVGLVAFTIIAPEKMPVGHRILSEQLNAPSGWYLALVSWAVPGFVGLAVVTFDLMRHGTGIGLKQLVERIGQFRLNGRSTWPRSFHSPGGAQTWLEWSERGFAYPIVALLISVITPFIVLWLGPGKTRHEGEAFTVILSALFYVPLPVIGFFWGSRSSTFAFGEFSASRPLADRQIGAAVLRSATLGLLLAAVIGFCSFLLNLSLFGWSHPASILVDLFFTLRKAEHLGQLCRIVVGIWFFVCLVTSIALAGRRAIVLAFLLLAIWVAGCAIPNYITIISVNGFRWFYPTATLVLLVVAEVVAFVFAWRRDLITWPVLLVAAAIVALLLLTFDNLGRLDFSDGLCLLAIACLMPLPLVAAPLAVYHNRHR